jgi:hypothetical protein
MKTGLTQVLDLQKMKTGLTHLLHLQKVKAGITQDLHVQEMKTTLQHLEDQIMEDIQKLFIYLKASSEERHLHV